MGQIIGHVAALARFPVKSMAGEPLDAAEIDWQGMEGDRQYAFVLANNATRFPWLTGRNVSEMVLHRARFADPANPRGAAVEVEAPDGWRGGLRDPGLAERLAAAAREPVGLIQLGLGAYDAMPVSIASTAGHARVEAAHGSALDPRRFRINIIIESDAPESDWCGKRLAFGEDGAELLVTSPIDRCAMITINPDTGVRDPSVLRTVAQAFGNQYGVYAAPARKGMVRLGDEVRIVA
jgi:uncharacterized protein YcbX